MNYSAIPPQRLQHNEIYYNFRIVLKIRLNFEKKSCAGQNEIKVPGQVPIESSKEKDERGNKEKE